MKSEKFPNYGDYWKFDFLSIGWKLISFEEELKSERMMSAESEHSSNSTKAHEN